MYTLSVIYSDKNTQKHYHLKFWKKDQMMITMQTWHSTHLKIHLYHGRLNDERTPVPFTNLVVWQTTVCATRIFPIASCIHSKDEIQVHINYFSIKIIFNNHMQILAVFEILGNSWHFRYSIILIQGIQVQKIKKQN